MKSDCRFEWDALRKHDIGFLVTLKPMNTKETRYNNKESFLSQMGEVIVRGCEIEGLLNEDGKLIGKTSFFLSPFLKLVDDSLSLSRRREL